MDSQIFKSQPEKVGGKRKANKSLKAWVAFVKKVQKEEKLSYKDAIHRAKVRKDKGEKWMKGGNTEEDMDIDIDMEETDKDKDMDMDMEMDIDEEVPDESLEGGKRRRTRRRKSRSGRRHKSRRGGRSRRRHSRRH